MLSFHVKFVQTDRRTTVKHHAPDLLIRGHKKDSKLEPKVKHLPHIILIWTCPQSLPCSKLTVNFSNSALRLFQYQTNDS